MATPRGTKFTPAHVAALMQSRAASPAWADGRERARAKLAGRRPPLETIAASLATRSLRSLGLSREDAAVLWEAYYELHLAELRERHGS